MRAFTVSDRFGYVFTSRAVIVPNDAGLWESVQTTLPTLQGWENGRDHTLVSIAREDKGCDYSGAGHYTVTTRGGYRLTIHVTERL
jgi:hypothetical protein